MKRTRRELLTGAGGLVATGAALRAGAAKALDVDACGRVANPSTFVLVHGLWCGGFVYDEVAAILRKRGHRVFTPTLTGLGDRSHLASRSINLDTHIEDVVNVLKWEELGDPVLAGHSYGGMIITGVADRMPDRISSLVYLDAVVPEEGEALIDLGSRPELVAEMRALHDRGESLFPMPPGLAQAFGIAEKARWKFSPHPMETLVEPIRLTGAYKGVGKRTFVSATKSSTAAVYERLRKDPAWRAVTIPTGHMMMTEAPERTAEILEEAI